MKQTIEIEVPEGKIAVWEEGKVVFKDKEPHWKSLRTFGDCARYLIGNHLGEDLVMEYKSILSSPYSEVICKYRIVVAALTGNEKRSLTTGRRWIPTIEFCRPDCLGDCYGDKVVGKIRSEGEEYLVVGGHANDGADDGLGGFASLTGASSSWMYPGIRSVSSKEIATHISTYFGRLLFEIQFGGCNCDWEWVD